MFLEASYLTFGRPRRLIAYDLTLFSTTFEPPASCSKGHLPFWKKAERFPKSIWKNRLEVAFLKRNQISLNFLQTVS